MGDNRAGGGSKIVEVEEVKRVMLGKAQTPGQQAKDAVLKAQIQALCKAAAPPVELGGGSH